VDGVEVVNVSDRVFLAHLGGKLEVRPRSPLKTRDDLSMVYTPGVGRVSRAIAEDPDKVWNLTVKRNTVAVVSDGTAVLGLGDIGPEAALPVMEGKAVLFKEFAGVDAFPICLDTKDPDEIVRIVEAIAPAFGGINLEDISAPRCFEIEQRLRETLDIPVFHDDQHGTAVVVLAALLNALRLVDKRIEDVRIVTTGCGAAGMAVTRALQNAGATWIVGCDEGGALYRGRTGLNPAKQEYAESTNPDNLQGTADELLDGADVFIGVSVPGAISIEGVRRMAPRAIVFAMANPNPEVDPEAIEDLAEIIATGRSDYPNQINNVLAFPGIFRGALDVRARTIDAEMELAAAQAIAAAIAPDELSPDYVIPSVFNRSVAPAVAAAVADAAQRSGVARRSVPTTPAVP
jgi:malate dehydrogenase (oxaloacetate-decarboxylating)